MEREKIYAVLMGMIAAFIVAITSGCGTSTGWRVEFGVSPIKELENKAGIKQEFEHAKKY